MDLVWENTSCNTAFSCVGNDLVSLVPRLSVSFLVLCSVSLHSNPLHIIIRWMSIMSICMTDMTYKCHIYYISLLFNISSRSPIIHRDSQKSFIHLASPFLNIFQNEFPHSSQSNLFNTASIS